MSEPELVPESSPRPCPLCGDKRQGLAFRKSGFDFRRCRRCGFLSVNPPPTAACLRALYDGWAAEYTSSRRLEGGEAVSYDRLLSDLERWRGEGGRRLLDVGANVGLFLAAARRRGWEVSGIEPSTGAARLASERLGIKVLPCGIEEAELPAAGFDVVTMHAVLEHLLDPVGALRKAAGWLRPGGCLYVSVPNLAGLSFRLFGRRYPYVHPTHISYFTSGTLRAALAASGLAPLEIRTGYTSLGLLVETARATLARRQADTQAAFAGEARVVGAVRRRPFLAPVRLAGRAVVRGAAAVGMGDVLEAFARAGR